MNALTLLKESMEREITHETSVLERFLREKPDQTYNIDRIRRQLSIKKDQYSLLTTGLKEIGDKLASNLSGATPKNARKTTEDMAIEVYDHLCLNFKPGDIVTSNDIPESFGPLSRRSRLLRYMENNNLVAQRSGSINKFLKFELK